MKVNLSNSGDLLVVPETDFEQQYLSTNYESHKNFKAYVRSGLSEADYIGIKIERPKVETED